MSGLWEGDSQKVSRCVRNQSDSLRASVRSGETSSPTATRRQVNTPERYPAERRGKNRFHIMNSIRFRWHTCGLYKSQCLGMGAGSWSLPDVSPGNSVCFFTERKLSRCCRRWLSAKAGYRLFDAGASPAYTDRSKHDTDVCGESIP